jgi:adenylate cyclase
MANSTRRFLEAGLSERSIAEMTRVLGESMARLAATTAAAFVETFLHPGDSEYDVAMRFAGLAEEFAPAVHPVLMAAYNAHLRDAVRRGMIGRAEREVGAPANAQELTVCFADLVGFTRLGEEVEPGELGRLAVRLEALAGDIAQPPVRLVKTIGDAAMLASPDPEPLLGATLELIGAADAEGEDFPQLRGGAAVGDAVPRAGDWFGRPVNLASRITSVARPGSLLVEAGLRDAIDGGFRFSFAGQRRLKGLREPVALYRARRAADD